MTLKDQTLCPKCGRMYCEGFWSEGVCTADMHFCGEPTSDFDESGRCFRCWYERHRETWWDRNRHSKNQRLLNAGTADEFMLALLNEVRRIAAEHERQTRSHGPSDRADRLPVLLCGWTKWGGGQCPLPAGTQFEYRLRNGGTGEPLWNPTAWSWGHDGGEYDIIAYRVLSQLAHAEEANGTGP